MESPIRAGIVAWRHSHSFEFLTGNVHHRLEMMTDSGFAVEATYSGSTEIYEKFGLVDVQIEPYENAKVVIENPKLWASFLQQPGLAMVKATKKLN